MTTRIYALDVIPVGPAQLDAASFPYAQCGRRADSGSLVYRCNRTEGHVAAGGFESAAHVAADGRGRIVAAWIEE